MPRLLLIDALNLIRRIHAAVPAPDENSQVDGALSATLSSLMRALKQCQPSHALVVFDGDPPTWRHKLFPAYKSQRKPMPEALRSRLTEFNLLFRNNGIMTFRRNGIEADDIIAVITLKAIRANISTTILSTDKIYRQLLESPLVTLRDHFHQTDTLRESIETELSLKPEQLVDFWAMAGIGDIPGVTGIGEKGAQKLLQEHGSLNQIMAYEGEAEEVKGALAKVLQQKEQAQLSKKLASLQEGMDLGISLKDMRYRGHEKAE